MFILSTDKSARAQLAALSGQLETQVRERIEERAKLKARNEQAYRTDSYKAISAEIGVLNETIAFIQGIDVMHDTNRSGSVHDLTADLCIHFHTYDVVNYSKHVHMTDRDLTSYLKAVGMVGIDIQACTNTDCKEYKTAQNS